MNYQTKNLVVFDLEIYKNLFLCGFLTPDGIVTQFEDRKALSIALQLIESSQFELVGFNSERYDCPVMSEFLRTGSTLAAYNASKAIIHDNVQPWSYDVTYSSVDLMPLLPGRMSLKQIGVRLHHKKLQELPIHWNKELTEGEKEIIREYNKNDLYITRRLLDEIQPELDLRGDLSRQHSMDLRSKGDAGIAEEVISLKVGASLCINKAGLKRMARKTIADYPKIIVAPPTWIGGVDTVKGTHVDSVISSQYQRFNSPIPLDRNGRLALPKLPNLYLDDKYYAIGAGGLHSVDGPGSYTPTKHEFLVDIDVTSYYPSIMLTQGLFPRHLGVVMDSLFKSMYEKRIKAKSKGDKVTADRFKIILNSSFGKTSDPYSALYDPQVTAGITIIGQVSLLILIAMLADAGLKTVSANTDGITVIGDNEQKAQLGITVGAWERLTQFNMEYTYYESVYSRDCNNYIAVKSGGGIKGKGIFAVKPGVDLRHSLKGNIIAAAVKQHVSCGTSISETIRECADINQFLLSHAATGDYRCTWWGNDIGKLVRFYKSTSNVAAPIIKTDSVKCRSSKVPQSENCKPVQDLPDTFPDDIDYEWYINEAVMLHRAISPPKKFGMNAKANDLVIQGKCPYVRKKNKKRTKRILKRMDPGTNDFNAMTVAEEFGFRGESELDGQ